MIPLEELVGLVVRVFLRLLLAVFLLTSTAVAQDKWKKIGLFTASVVFNAVGDGLYDEGRKTEAKLLRTASIATLLSVPIFTKVNKNNGFDYVITFTGIRYGLFDAGYNLTRGLPYDYLGTTSHVDLFLKNLPKPLVTSTKVLSLGIIICKRNKKQ